MDVETKRSDYPGNSDSLLLGTGCGDGSDMLLKDMTAHRDNEIVCKANGRCEVSEL
jgi:hypothetical protein